MRQNEVMLEGSKEVTSSVVSQFLQPLSLPSSAAGGGLVRVDELIERLKEEPKECRDVILEVYGELKGDWRHVFTMIVALTSLFTAVIPLIKTFLWRIAAFMLCVMVEVFLGREILNIDKELRRATQYYGQ